MASTNQHWGIVAAIAVVGLIAFSMNISIGMLIVISILAVFFWLITEANLFIVSAGVGFVLLTIGAPVEVGIAIAVTVILLLMSLPAVIGILVGNFAHNRRKRHKGLTNASV